MASLPARRSSQRRSSPSEQQPQQSTPQTNESPVRSRSEDSQTIFVNKPEEERLGQQEQTEPSIVTAAGNIDDDPSIKRCWICMSDSTEDTPQTSPWRDPCPCALVAHEECLLDWIADIEAPNRSSRNPGIAAPKIECPQCKSEIKLARPRDYIVDAVKMLERIGGRMVLPASGAGMITILSNISMSVGVHSIYAVFGASDGNRILQPITMNAIRPPVEVYAGVPGEAGKQIWRLIMDHAVHWRLYLGVPLITPILILSRTSLADQALPVLPIIFFASQAHSPDDALDLLQWPPSASFSFAILPYLRALYNTYYKTVWAEREQQWIKEVQPRAQAEDEVEGAGQGQQNAADDQGEGENVFEVRIDGGILDDWDADTDDEEEAARLVQEAADDVPAEPPVQPHAEPVQDNVDADVAPAPVVPDDRGRERDQQPGQAAAQVQDAADQNQNQGQNQNQPAQVQRRLSFSPTGVAETVLGALFFPTIAGLSGEALKLVLPRSWTTPPFTSWWSGRGVSQPKGFFQSKWARSLVGGCLFIVFKDALMLYARWKTAQMHRRRRVVDHHRRETASA